MFKELVRPGQDEHNERDTDVSGAHGDPHLHGHGRQEGEQTGRLFLRFFVQNADARVHERQREIHRLLTLVADGQVSNGQIRFLSQTS